VNQTNSIMQKETKLLIVACLFLLGLSACDKENYDIVTEESAHTPTEVINDEPYFSFQIADVGKETKGYGVIIEVAGFYVISSDSIFCKGENGFGIISDGDGDNFHFTFFLDSQGTATLPFSTLSYEENGDTITVFNNSLHYDCTPDAYPTVEFTEVTEDRMTGTYRGEFFRFTGDDSDSCDSWQSVGILESDFSVPLRSCP